MEEDKKVQSSFEKRQVLFQERLEELMVEFEMDIYAANVIMQNGEVLPMIKMGDKKVTKKEDGDKAKK